MSTRNGPHWGGDKPHNSPGRPSPLSDLCPHRAVHTATYHICGRPPPPPRAGPGLPPRPGRLPPGAAGRGPPPPRVAGRPHPRPRGHRHPPRALFGWDRPSFTGVHVGGGEITAARTVLCQGLGENLSCLRNMCGRLPQPFPASFSWLATLLCRPAGVRRLSRVQREGRSLSAVSPPQSSWCPQSSGVQCCSQPCGRGGGW